MIACCVVSCCRVVCVAMTLAAMQQLRSCLNEWLSMGQSVVVVSVVREITSSSVAFDFINGRVANH